MVTPQELPARKKKKKTATPPQLVESEDEADEDKKSPEGMQWEDPQRGQQRNLKLDTAELNKEFAEKK